MSKQQPTPRRKNADPAPSSMPSAAPPAMSPAMSPAAVNGRDEMNLAEFPIGKLGVRDKRETLTYEGWMTDKQGTRFRQKWSVSGSQQYGLPHELGNRILVVFITLAAERQTQKVYFTDYQILRLLRLSDGQANYRHFERNLMQLAGLTIYSEQAFWDNEQERYLTTKRAFHIFDDVWLSSWPDGRGADATADATAGARISGGQGYVVFNDVFWSNIQSGYLKSLDLEFYLGTLQSALARQLYRCLDKFMRYRTVFEIDLFDLAGRIGLQSYPYPSQVKEKLQPAIRELSDGGFLARTTFRKVGKYTRVRFVKAAPLADAEGESTRKGAEGAKARGEEAEPDTEPDTEAEPFETEPIGTEPPRDPTPALYQTLWEAVLQGLSGQLPSATFFSFVEPTVLLSLEDGVASVGARNPTATSWLQARMVKRFQDELNYHLRAAGRAEVGALTVTPLERGQ